MLKIQYRESRDRYGFVVLRHGKRKPHFRWKTKGEAEKAYYKMCLTPEEEIPKKVVAYPLGVVAKDYIDDAKKNKSKWRFDALHWNFNSIILPHFNGDTPATQINCLKIEKFVDYYIEQGRKNSTIWHYVTDIRGMFNFAIKKTLRARDGVEGETDYGVTANPVNLADLHKIKNRKVIKRELDLAEVDRAAEVLSGQDRIYFDCLRYTGLRKDEANRLQWDNLDLVRGKLLVPGTKTEGSYTVLPLAPILQKEFNLLKKVANLNCPWVFPGRSPKTDGKKVYRRTRMFEKIYRETGIKITAKDLRDIFATTISGGPEGGDPNTMMRLLRHTSLTTTTKYLRVVTDRMAAAVKGLGE